ncbi:hypothetical protein GGD81_003413 [Rhodobium orientis]|uniref:Uncharacterized protein n=1 Tax=Rhodobium orientis TaxID=34017 RepID=A0A327K0F3_9HYPH|nr:hypothetical protein [Rhodobium orientis]MBB4304355.1 hypothetical protein [Rhodobium orientis]MBK5948151.1 hypothetical protein [Rhodobium orientis]RAI28848.1 hypothetical protein CH339_05495 [Rhodobium orientis]
MPIRFAQDSPKNAGAAVEEFLAERDTSMATSLEQRFAAGGTVVSNAIRVWYPDLEALAGGAPLAESRPGNWRHLVGDAQTMRAEAELAADGGAARVVAFHEGPRAGAMAAGLTRALDLDAVQKGDYEARLLEAPGVHFTALWLHGDDDIFIPIEPNLTELKNGKPHSEDEVREVLAKRAAEVLETQQAMPGPSGG